MSKRTAVSEPISKNIFEAFYQIIEKKRLKYPNDNDLYQAFNFLEKIVLLIERQIQDLNSKKLAKRHLILINSGIEKLLSSWYDIIIMLEEEFDIINSISYNLVPTISLIREVSVKGKDLDLCVVQFNDHLNKLLPQRYILSNLQEVDLIKIARALDLDDQEELLKLGYPRLRNDINFFNDLPVDIQQSIYREYHSVDLIKSIVSITTEKLMHRYKTNVFNINFDKTFYEIEIDNIKAYLDTKDFYESLERLYEFDEDKEVAIWNVKITITDTDNAASIGYTLWAFSKALETIKDIDVKLIEWGEGSKWVNLKVEIRSNAAKIDLNEILNKVRYDIISDETQVSTANELVESKKQSSQDKPVVDVVDKIQDQLDVYKQALDLERQSVEIESIRADARLKNLEVLKGISELMKSGLTVDSTIQVMINDLLYLNVTKGTPFFQGERLREIESKETYRKITKDSESEEETENK